MVYIRNKWLSVIWKLITAGCGFVGIEMSLHLFSGSPNWQMLNFFTILSNIAAAIYFLTAAIYLITKKNPPSTVFPTAKGIVTMSLTVTMLVAHFLLGGFTMDGNASLTLMLLHYIAPLMAVADWLFFDRKGEIKKTAPLFWTVAPLLYFLFAMIAARIGDGIGYGGSRYPYPFIDIDANGIPKVAVTVVVLVIFFVALGYLFYIIDRLMSRLDKNKGQNDGGKEKT